MKKHRKRGAKAPDREEADQMFTAAVTVLSGTWNLAQHYGVCPVCLMEVCMDMMEDALNDGRIEHGIIPEEDTFVHVMGGGETLQ